MKSEKLKIALLQIMPTGTMKGNMEKGLSACRQAKGVGADIALFPEMWSSGYYIPTELNVLDEQAVSAADDFVMAFKNLAKELNMSIGITLLEKCEQAPRNSLLLFDRYGNEVLSYAKVHTCDFGDEARLSSGEDFPVAQLDTRIGNVRVGAMICYDREFPESARILMLKGAEIILVPNACPMEINRLSQLRARAYENMTAIATVNYPSGKPDCNGHSTAFDGVAYDIDGKSRDMLILEANEDEEILIAEFDINLLREYRRNEVHGNSYRQPRKYTLLIDTKVEEPFIRKDKRV